ncbi:glycine--tRNA ligase [Pseudactinotalea sp. Z1748]|uniref:glycine--tRNA ligase n=1 Tax=Pseudactinotalea sp. Z1748 TaxID=3413027 RepID=UPI003C7C330D
MQDAIRALTEYWTSHGCLITQPYNTEVGAGTMNPATVLRVLGPEPWNVAYVEPSVRPDDSRYGQNPNRLQTHTQFQVILKPEPANPQELYLGSLEALGIDLRAHDVRFVEDNWQQPAIGAWGLGWEVWLDGLEITQFTYFQQVGGQNLDPVPVELTYGLERILMAVQGVDHFADLAYAPGITYGEAFGQTEYEMSRYYLDDADVATNQSLYEHYVSEAKRMIEARLPVPGHNYLLKSSHAFNVLDARGAISTTERANAFGTMRRLAREISALWVDRREELGFPLLKDTPAEPVQLPVVDAGALPAQAQVFALEIGVEELPPHVVDESVEAVGAAVREALGASRLEHGEVHVDATPRRIVVTVDDVAAREADAVQWRKGPKWAAAFDDSGAPTKALQGFMRGQGAELADVQEAEIGGNTHAAVRVNVPGRGVLDVLGPLVTHVVTGLRADKNMRWSDPELSYSRAIRWLVALWGPVVVPAAASRLVAGRTTHVHRLDDQPAVDIASAEELRPALAERGIEVSVTRRREQVLVRAQELAAEVGGHIDAEATAGLVAEIANLVETPVGIRGDFAARYLELPEQVLTTVMATHQRYLPVRDADGALLPHFITMANGACDEAAVARGNESVLRARYEDALFFWNTDLESGDLDAFVPGLDKLTFADGLGSVGLRARRIADVATVLGQLVHVPDADRTTLNRAGELIKFDLATQMVIEMSSLAGFVAGEYARRTGESETVATALVETEQPRTSADATPKTVPGVLLALADRADLLVGLLATGARATGSSDPFGLRRAALGIVRILRSLQQASFVEALTLRTVLQAAADRLRAQDVAAGPEQVQAAAEFAESRFAQLLRDEGIRAELVTAVGPAMDRPARVDQTLAELDALLDRADFAALVAVVQRINRIVPPGTPAQPASDLLTEKAELALRDTLAALPPSSSLTGFTDDSAGLVASVNTFFDAILVMAPQEDLRQARLGLLAAVAQRVPGDVDWAGLDTALSVR